MYTKLVPSDKANYKPVSVLPLLLKVFEKVIYDQLYEYSEIFLSAILWFLKGLFNTSCSFQTTSEMAGIA